MPALDFVDTSGEAGDQTGDHAARLDRFAATLRAELAAPGTVDVVLPACDGACSPARTPFAAMAEATRAAGAERLLVGNIHKISTLIGTVKLTLIDLPGDRVLCTRTLTYRGDRRRGLGPRGALRRRGRAGELPALTPLQNRLSCSGRDRGTRKRSVRSGGWPRRRPRRASAASKRRAISVAITPSPFIRRPHCGS